MKNLKIHPAPAALLILTAAAVLLGSKHFFPSAFRSAPDRMRSDTDSGLGRINDYFLENDIKQASCLTPWNAASSTAVAAAADLSCPDPSTPIPAFGPMDLRTQREHGLTFQWRSGGTMRIQPSADRGQQGLRVLPPETASVEIRMAGLSSAPVSSASSATASSAAEPPMPPAVAPETMRTEPGRLAATWAGGLEESWTWSTAGLEHAFTLPSRPAVRGSGKNGDATGENAAPLRIALEVRTRLNPVLENPDSVLFLDHEGAPVWSYRHLVVTDADQRPVPAWMELQAPETATAGTGEDGPETENDKSETAHPRIVLCMNDSTARYPLLVDPIFASAERAALGSQPQDGADVDSFDASVVLGNAVYFNASDGALGQELWKTDTVTGQTTLVKDIYPGSTGGRPGLGSGFPYNLPVFKGYFYFGAMDPVKGNSLWRSDGTPEGTVTFYNFAATGAGGVTDCLVAADVMYFRVHTSGQGIYQLWRTDGTVAGTSLIINGGTTVPDLNNAAVLGNLLVYPGKDTEHGEELWVSDGTAAGTRLLTDILPGSFGSLPGKPLRVGGKLYFTINQTLENKPQLWVTDGTAGGTVRVPTGDGVPGQVLDLNGTAIFNTASPALPTALWRTDGTAAGTVMLRNFTTNAAFTIQPLAVAGGQAYLTYVTSTDCALWKTDGTSAGTSKVKSLGSAGIGRTMSVGSRLFMEVNTAATGSELWVSDGTAAGTVIVKDILPGSEGSKPWPLAATADVLYFKANDGIHGMELWKSDGTPAGTSMVRDVVWVSNSQRPSNMTVVGSQVFFQATTPETGRELWKYDTATSAAQLVKDLNPGSGNGLSTDYAQQFTASGNILYFAASTGVRTDLWRSDGTAGGTVLLQGTSGINRPNTIAGNNLYPFRGGLLFGQKDEMWWTDGTVDGTRKLGSGGYTAVMLGGTALYAGPGIGNYPFVYRTDGTAAGSGPVVAGGLNLRDNLMMTANGYNFFIGEDVTYGIELWKTDGTAGGTSLVRDLTTGTAGSSLALKATAGGRLFFTKNPSQTTSEFWSSDGTSAGTLRMATLKLNTGWAAISNLQPVGNLLFFSTNLKGSGLELWRSDGTAAGTLMLKSFFASNTVAGPKPSGLTTLGNRLLFTMETPENGRELWVSDGSVSGTTQLFDILPGIPSSDPAYLGQDAGLAYYAATDASHGRELWVTDGTAQGTRIVEDLSPGTDSSFPYWIGNAGGHLLAMYEKDPDASNAAGIREITITPGNDPPTLTAAPAAVPPVIGGTVSAGISFTATDNDTSPDALVWLATSSDPGILPTDAIRIIGTGNTRQLLIALRADAVPGTVDVILTLTDGVTTLTRLFPVRILADRTTFTRAADGQILISFTGLPGQTYAIQRSTDLATWQDVKTIIPGDTGSISWTDSAAPPRQAFYRLSGPR